MRPMRLYADVGNSGLLWAASAVQGWQASGRLVFDAQQPPRDTAAVLAALLETAGCPAEELEGAALVSSNPSLTDHVHQALGALVPQVAVMGVDLHSDLTVQYDRPEQLGRDRIAAIEGARVLRGAPVVALTCGTCVTGQALTKREVVVVGGIAPGLSVVIEGLCRKVPHLAQAARAAEQLILQGSYLQALARDTTHSLALGMEAALGGAALLMARSLLEVAEATEPVLLTGAAAEFLAQTLPGTWQVEPLLTLEGLRTVHERWLKER